MNQQACKVSVIIPCYNQGHYVGEAIESVLNQTYSNFEIIVVNDGSTDPVTLDYLEACNQPKTTIIHTTNQGLASARNNGIQAALGEYILPLDADDKIGLCYLERAVEILDQNPQVGIVYCEAEYFGDRTGKWELSEYRFPEILLGNVIFCSGFFRRVDWEQVGGYQKDMIYGWEDYDFWLSLIGLGREVYRIPETLFFYRQVEGSMTKSMQIEQFAYSYAQLYRHHTHLYEENIEAIFRRFILLESELHHAKIELQRTKTELQQNQGRMRDIITAIESSKFWQLRKIWLRFKDAIGLAKHLP